MSELLRFVKFIRNKTAHIWPKQIRPVMNESQKRGICPSWIDDLIEQ